MSQDINKFKKKAIIAAFAAAVFYAVNAPFSKLLLNYIGPKMLAAFLYLGAGIGVMLMSMFRKEKPERLQRLNRDDLPYTVGMIILDVAAPIFLMVGLSMTTAANASLLNSFEIVATTVIAWIVFRENVSIRLWIAVALTAIASALLSFEGMASFAFSKGSVFVLLAASCWGLENNCTRKISSKDTYEIVMVKGIFSGLGSLIIALFTGERFPGTNVIILAMLLGYVAYGLSIFFYIRAQSVIGAAKTSAYYASAPFIGAFLSFVILQEKLSPLYLTALLIMACGSAIAIGDTLQYSHSHIHTHTLYHLHGGHIEKEKITHSHEHRHLGNGNRHLHSHHGLPV